MGASANKSGNTCIYHKLFRIFADMKREVFERQKAFAGEQKFGSVL